MFILKYREWLRPLESEAIWVYDLCTELPEWSDFHKEYVFKREPKRIDAREAKILIKENNLKCVHETEDRERVYA